MQEEVTTNNNAVNDTCTHHDHDHDAIIQSEMQVVVTDFGSCLADNVPNQLVVGVQSMTEPRSTSCGWRLKWCR
jgi:hypothetical protein